MKTRQIVIEKIGYALGDGREDLWSLTEKALSSLLALPSSPSTSSLFGGVIAATFSNPERFPSLAVRVASVLGLRPETPAFDLQMACSAYPYAVYLAGRLAADTGKRVLVVNGDVQTPLVDAADHATGGIFSDAVTCSVVSSPADGSGESAFAFLSRYDAAALACAAGGPIRMDGMKVFTFVATEVRAFLARFLDGLEPEERASLAAFVPHQANPYMVRQLAKSLALEDRLVKLDEAVRNPGSCSIPLALAKSGVKGRVLVAGFGAGYSAAAGLVDVL